MEKTLFLISDLMFRSRVKETLGQQVLFAKSLDKAIEQIQSDHITAIFIDLNIKGASADPEIENFGLFLIKELKKNFPQIVITAFGSHVLDELLKQAATFGADKVLPNSGFIKLLEKHRAESGQAGASFLSLAVFGVIFGAGIWYLFQIIPIYYRYYELENAMRSLSRVAQDNNDKELRRKMLTHMREIGTPGRIQDVKMARTNDSLQIEYDYREEITITWGENTWTLQEFYFSLDILEEPVA